MDRVIVYAGAIPLDSDVLIAQRNALIGLGMLSQGVLGTSTVVDGLACNPATPTPNMTVVVGSGQIFSLANVDASGYGSLVADTAHSILKQGLALDPTTLTLTAPGTVGFAQNYLIQAAFSEVDDTPVVLPYFNPANPLLAFTGPGGAGTPQFTFRRGKCLVSAKAGVAAASGSQVTPAPDAGFVGLYVVTVTQGQTQITGGNIAQVGTAPFFPTKLPAVPSTSQSGVWNYAVDSGTANNLVVTLNPAPASISGGFPLRVRIAAANTGATAISVNGGAAVAVVHGDGSALNANDLRAGTVASLIHDGTRFQVLNVAYQTAGAASAGFFSYYAVDSSGAANSITAAFTPALTSLPAGTVVYVKVANQVTGATTITCNALAAKNVVRSDGGPLSNGDILAGQIVELVYDGAQFQCMSALNVPKFMRRFISTTNGSANFTAPVTGWYRVKLWGAGAGGGAGLATGAAGGAGSGGYAEDYIFLTAAQVVPYFVGLHGSGAAAATSNSGTSGSDTTFGTGPLCRASGGSPGAGANDGSAALGGAPGNGFATGANGKNLLGMAGYQGYRNGSPLFVMGGVGGQAPLGGQGGIGSLTTGNTGIAPGGGGGGGTNNGAGGDGADGRVEIEW